MGKAVREELANLLVHKVKDPTIQGVTITDVKVSPDLTVAHVFFAADDERAKQINTGLERAAPYLRRQIGARLHLKRSPELRFQRDMALEEGIKIDTILRDIAAQESSEEP